MSKKGWEENWKGSIPGTEMEKVREVMGISGRQPQIYNEVPIAIHQYPDRVFIETPGMNTHVTIDLPRGRF